MNRLATDHHNEQLHKQITESEGEKKEPKKPVVRPKRQAEQSRRVGIKPQTEKPSIDDKLAVPELMLKREMKPAETPDMEMAHKDNQPQPVTEVIEVVAKSPDVTDIEIYPEAILGTTEVLMPDYTSESTPVEFFDPYDPAIPPGEEIVIPQDMHLEADILSNDEMVFDEEVMDTFEQLLMLIRLEEEEEAPLADWELGETALPDEMFISDEISLLSQELAEAIQAVEINVFEEFVMAKDPPDESPDIETVVLEANYQPLEETLAQLSFYLAETAETEATEAPRDGKSTAIREALRDLAEILPPAAGPNYAGQAEKPAITPEMTQKLLVLLRAVGYDEPGEVLIGFIKQHGFEFLLQAIRYLYQLSDDTNRQEFLSSKAVDFTSKDADEPLTARIGRAIMRRLFLPDPAILLS